MITDHRVDQAVRFLRLFCLTFVSSGILDQSHLTRSAVIATLLATLETTYRQFNKVTPVTKG